MSELGRLRVSGVMTDVPAKRVLWYAYMGVSKNRGTPKWMVYNGTFIKMDDLGVPLYIFGNTHIL